MIDPEIREASIDCLAQVAELQDEARSAMTGQRGADRWLEEHPPRQWTDTSRSVSVLVGDLDGVITGYLVLEQAGDGIWVVDEVYVSAWARELGYGDGLLGAAVSRARAGAGRRLEAVALPGDRDTKNLYERAGITARAITVSTTLD